MSTRRTAAVYGGSFNPPHRAHVLVAEHVAADPAIDELWIVPTFQHAFDKELVSFEHRLHMCQRAFFGIARTRVLDIERELAGRSLMVRTLEALAARHPEMQLRLVIGSDLVDQLDTWTDPQRIRALAPPLIVQREGSERDDVSGPVFPLISSTAVRERLARGEAVDAWVPHAVIEYISTHGLYRSAH